MQHGTPKGSLDGLEAFVRVARLGTLRAAARELGVPTSTVGRRLSRLEEGVRTQLLHRDGRSVVLTDEGRRLFERVGSAVDTIEGALQGATEGAELARGLVRLSAPADFGQLVVLRALQAFAHLHPDIRFEIELSNRYVDVVQEGFDLALRAGAGPGSANLIARNLGRGTLGLAASPERARRIRQWSDLAEEPFVFFGEGGHARSLRLVDPQGAWCGAKVKGRFVVRDYTAMAALISDGVGVGLMPTFHIRHAAREGRLAPVLPRFSLPAHEIKLVYPSRDLPYRVELVLEHLTAVLKPELEPL